MTRRILFFLICIFVLISACSLFDDSSSPGEATEAFAPEATTSLSPGEHHFTEFDVPAGVDVSLMADVEILVDGDVQIAGMVQGDCTSFELRAGGDLGLTGQIDTSCASSVSNGDVHLVVAGLAAIGADGSGTPAIIAGGDIVIADTEGEDLDLNQVISEAEEALAPPSGAGRQSSPPQQGATGATISSPLQPGPGGSINVPFNMQGAAVTIATSLTAPAGAAGADLQDTPNCDATGNKGKPGGSIRLAAPNGALVVNPGVTLKAGDGGKGGDCTAQGDGADQTASAGDGGRGGSVLVGGRGLTMNGVTVTRGSGGAGGSAIAVAGNAEEACGRGFNATAVAGQGGDRGGVGYVIIEPANVQGAPNVTGGNGGRGGNADATAGDGEECHQCPAGEGGKGGDATATGGQGGDGATRSLNWNITDGHKKGDGGNATAKAGDGNTGATCCEPPEAGGAGGPGGGATATAGQPGARGKVDGIAGTSGNSPAGTGGDGGLGSTGGDGGEGGTGAGTPNMITDGDDGSPGLVCAEPIVSWIDDQEDPLICDDLMPSDAVSLLGLSDITSIEIELTDLGEYVFRTVFRVDGDLETTIVESDEAIFDASIKVYSPALELVSTDPWTPNQIAQQNFSVIYNRFTEEFESAVAVVENGQWAWIDETFPYTFEDNVLTVTLNQDQILEGGTIAEIAGTWNQSTNLWICDEVGLSEDGLPGIGLPGTVISETLTVPPGSLATPLPPPTPFPIGPTGVYSNSSGVYTSTFVTSYDPVLHGPHVDMADELPLMVLIDGQLISFVGEAPFVKTEGSVESDGSFETEGSGEVAGFSGIKVVLTGQFAPNGLTYTGTYTMGDAGGLPNNAPIAFAVNGVRAESPADGEPTDNQAWAENFAEDFSLAFENQDTGALFDLLNPAVINLYGALACETYLESIIGNPIQIEVLNVDYIGLWAWERDGRVIDVPDAYAVLVNFTAGDDTSEVEMHLTQDLDGDGQWFTDCGEPQ